MGKKHDAIVFAPSLVFKAVIVAAKYSGRVRKRRLERLAATHADTKGKEMLFLKDEVCKLEMQVSIVQKQIKRQQKRPRYTIREGLFVY